MCPISAVFGVRSITIHSPRRTRALCWSRSRADILWYRVQMGAHEWSWKDFSLTSTWSPKIAQKFRGATTLVADWDLRNSTLASKACFGPYPLINAKLIRFGPLWNENPFFLLHFSWKIQAFQTNYTPAKEIQQTIPHWILANNGKYGPLAELLRVELHHPLGTRHLLVFGLHDDVSEKNQNIWKIYFSFS